MGCTLLRGRKEEMQKGRVGTKSEGKLGPVMVVMVGLVSIRLTQRRIAAAGGTCRRPAEALCSSARGS